MLKKSELPPCPIALTIGLIGSKWKLYVLREFVLNGERHFGELLRAVEGISKKSLTELDDLLNSLNLHFGMDVTPYKLDKD